MAEARSAGLADLHETLIHTGQHSDWEMSDIFFEQLRIPEPAKNLGVSGGTHAEMTAKMLVSLETEFIERRPDLVLLYGDTNSTLAGALAASKLGIPIAHVEAGPRTYKKEHPEEVNRIIVDNLSEMLFCPTEQSCENLRLENITEGVHFVGDVMLDAVLESKQYKQPISPMPREPYVVATIHRPFNTDDGERLVKLISCLNSFPFTVVLPVHPRLKAALERERLDFSDNVVAIPPMSYLQILGAVSDSAFVLSDSGGLPKEAYFLGKRSLTISPETPWPELEEVGATCVVDCDVERIRNKIEWAIGEPDRTRKPFGKGDAAGKIVDLICSKFNLTLAVSRQ